MFVYNSYVPILYYDRVNVNSGCNTGSAARITALRVSVQRIYTQFH